MPERCTALVVLWLAVASHVVAACFLLHGIYPRLSTAGDGVLFWDDVRTRASADIYADEIADLTAEEVERAYARNNFLVADILHRKFFAVRAALIFTALALTFAIVSVLAR